MRAFGRARVGARAGGRSRRSRRFAAHSARKASPSSALACRAPGPVAQHDEAEALPVRPRGRAAGVPHDRVQVVVGDRVGPEAPDGPGGGHALEQADGLVGHHATYGRAMSGDDPDPLRLDQRDDRPCRDHPTAGRLRRRRHPPGLARAVRAVRRRHAGAGGHGDRPAHASSPVPRSWARSSAARSSGSRSSSW